VLKISKHHSSTRDYSFLWIIENLRDAFCEIKGLEEDAGVFPFSDLDLLDIMKTIIKIIARIKIDKLENLRKFKRLRKKIGYTFKSQINYLKVAYLELERVSNNFYRMNFGLGRFKRGWNGLGMKRIEEGRRGCRWKEKK